MAHGQYVSSVGSCGTPPPLSQSPVPSLFEVVPSMCVSERYDSNVFYRPPSPGLQREDFVTHVNPMLQVNHNGTYASGVLNMGGFSETYVKNPDLNFLGTSNRLFLNLDNSIKRLLPNASLNVTDTLIYTPLPPGFVNPAAGTSPSNPSNTQSVYAQGLLGFRTNNLTNNATVSTAYATTASTALNASYSYAIIRFGSSPSTQGQTLLDTTTQTGAVGGTVQLSESDMLNVRYTHTQGVATPSATSTGATPLFYKIDNVTIGWSRRLSPNLTAEVGGGTILISSGQSTYSGNAALILDSVNNSATVSYRHSAFPNFYGGGQVLIGDTFILSALQKIDRKWWLAETVSYAHTFSEGGLSTLTYDSFVAGGEILYWVTNIWSTALSYSYTKYNQETGSTNSDFVRQFITLSVRATWE